MKAGMVFVSAILVVDSFFVSYFYGMHSHSVNVVDPKLPSVKAAEPVKAKAAAPAKSTAAADADKKKKTEGTKKTKSSSSKDKTKKTTKPKHSKPKTD